MLREPLKSPDDILPDNLIPTPFFTTDQLASLVLMEITTVYRLLWRDCNHWPRRYMKIGNHIRRVFTAQEVKALQEHRLIVGAENAMRLHRLRPHDPHYQQAYDHVHRESETGGTAPTGGEGGKNSTSVMSVSTSPSISQESEPSQDTRESTYSISQDFEPPPEPSDSTYAEEETEEGSVLPIYKEGT